MFVIKPIYTYLYCNQPSQFARCLSNMHHLLITYIDPTNVFLFISRACRRFKQVLSGCHLSGHHRIGSDYPVQGLSADQVQLDAAHSHIAAGRHTISIHPFQRHTTKHLTRIIHTHTAAFCDHIELMICRYAVFWLLFTSYAQI